jgi:predicted nucleic acid-binding Zn ribbon protein
MYIYRMEIRECLACKEAVKGRVDKKFCSDYCRNAYNNQVNKGSKNLIRNINNRLRKNYKILSELNVSGKTKVTRTKLYDNGFDFQFFTSIYKTKTGNTYFYVYNEGYLTLENDTFLLIRKER